jgi:hypothetical protein
MPKNKRPSGTRTAKRTSTTRRGQPPLVRASYEELLSFLRYFRHFGTPIIIGGWAVYFYNPYYGSVDIDVVGPSLRGTFYETIERYERSHGYVITQNDALGIEVTASKPIFNKGSKKKRRKIGDMQIDAFTRISGDHQIKDLVRDTLREVLNDRAALALYGRSVDTKSILKSMDNVL